MHFLLLAESDLALVVDNLRILSVGLPRFIQILSIVLIKFVKEAIEDVLRLGLINFLLPGVLFRGQGHLAFVGLHATCWEHETRQCLLILLCVAKQRPCVSDNCTFKLDLH